MEDASPDVSVDPSCELSVVVPMYRGEECLGELHRRLAATLDELVGAKAWELVLVDDRSPDGGWARMRELAASDARVHALRLSRNFGQEAATSAGFAHARGRWIVTMDCDLQDRPEDIPLLYAEALRGFRNVRARRAKEGGGYRVLGTRAYFWLLNKMAGTNVDWQFAAFGIMASEVRDAYLTVPDRHRNLLLVLDWLGFESSAVDVAHDERFAGDSSYTFRRLLSYAVSGIFFQTTAPLRWIVYLGLVEGTAGFLGAIFVVVRKLGGGHYAAGWPSLITTILLVGGITVASIGVAALYIGSIFDQVKARPRYIVEDVVNAGQAPTDPAATPARSEASPRPAGRPAEVR